MQVTALTSTYTGSQRQQNDLLFGDKNAKKRDFEDFLYAPSKAGAAMEPTPEELEDALERTIARMETLLGVEVAESVVTENGSVDLVRLAQVMNAAERPYANSGQNTYVNAPQMVNLIA